MGVRNLNSLIKYYDSILSQFYPKKYKHVIVDGNNMVITFIESTVTKLKNMIKNEIMDKNDEKYNDSVFKQGNLDNIISTLTENEIINNEQLVKINESIKNKYTLIYQIKFVIVKTFESIVKEFDRFSKKFKTECIWFITDPPNETKYTVDFDTYNLVDKDFMYIYNKDRLKESNIIDLGCKTEEQNIRKKQQLKKEPINLTSINYFDKMTNKLFIAKIIFKLLCNRANYTINMEIDKNDYTNNLIPLDSYKLIFVKTDTDEADFIIKNIAHNLCKLHEEDNILISSRDSDYKVLFANDPHVYVSDLYANSRIYNAYSIWKHIFGDMNDDIYEKIIRLITVCGNDYTTHKGFIQLDKYNKQTHQRILKMFNLDETCDLNSKTKLVKFIQFESNKYSGNVSVEQFDNIIKEFCLSNIDKEYNEKYYYMYLQSVNIHKNYTHFNSFRISNKLHTTVITKIYNYFNEDIKNISNIDIMKNDFIKYFNSPLTSIHDNIDRVIIEDDYFE